MAYTETIRLGFGHNLIISNFVPAMQANMEKLAEIHSKGRDIGSFGLFDVASPNFNHYYPGVSENDLKPKDADFVQPIYRALSEVIVHKNYSPVDFSMGEVLKRSMQKLVGQSIYANHEAMVGNELGSVPAVSWENATKDSKTGILIPAGINAVMKVDGKSNPKIARGIMMDPPSVHSTSVTVNFSWEKSHPNLTDEDWRNKFGTYYSDGQLIRRIASKIHKYNEISFVSHGADPYAQKKTPNGIANPVHANDTYNNSEITKNQFFFYDFQYDLISNEEKDTIPAESNDNKETTSNSNNTPTMNKYLLQMAAILGITIEGKTEDQLGTEVSNKLTTLNQSNITQTTEVTRLKEVETEYTGKKTELQEIPALKQFRTDRFTGLRTRVTEIYNKVTDGKPNTSLLDLIKNADYAALEALEIQYSEQLSAKFPAKCQKCGSQEISRASSSQSSQGNGDEGKDDKNKSGEGTGGTFKELETSDAMTALREKKLGEASKSFYSEGNE